MKTKLFLIAALFFAVVTNAQTEDLSFTFENARNTNDGTDDFYEADIFIAASSTIKVGSGILFFNYNTDAFGEEVDFRNENGNPGSFEYIQPDGSLLGEATPGPFGPFAHYRDFVVNDNTPSRVAVSFQPNASRGVLTDVTPTPRLLCSIKFKFIDINEPANVEFANGDNPLFEDGFFTACGPETPGQADCIGEPGVQIVGDETFDSSEATLSVSDFSRTIEGDNVLLLQSRDTLEVQHPDSLDFSAFSVFNIGGAEVISGTTKEINTAALLSGIYIAVLEFDTGIIVKKFVK